MCNTAGGWYVLVVSQGWGSEATGDKSLHPLICFAMLMAWTPLWPRPMWLFIYHSANLLWLCERTCSVAIACTPSSRSQATDSSTHPPQIKRGHLWLSRACTSCPFKTSPLSMSSSCLPGTCLLANSRCSSNTSLPVDKVTSISPQLRPYLLRVSNMYFFEVLKSRFMLRSRTCAAWLACC